MASAMNATAIVAASRRSNRPYTPVFPVAPSAIVSAMIRMPVARVGQAQACQPGMQDRAHRHGPAAGAQRGPDGEQRKQDGRGAGVGEQMGKERPVRRGDRVHVADGITPDAVVRSLPGGGHQDAGHEDDLGGDAQPRKAPDPRRPAGRLGRVPAAHRAEHIGMSADHFLVLSSQPRHHTGTSPENGCRLGERPSPNQYDSARPRSKVRHAVQASSALWPIPLPALATRSWFPRPPSRRPSACRPGYANG